MKGNELKPHIGIFGRRNYGKSSLINYLTQQRIAIVSDTPGTTTDPVKKTMELLGVGPVIWIDTPGIDDEGALGQQRVEQALQVLPQCDLALILLAHNTFEDLEQQLLARCQQYDVPFLLIYSLSDVAPPDPSLLQQIERRYATPVFSFSCYDEACRKPLEALIHKALPVSSYRHTSLLGDVVKKDDRVVLVTPIDTEAPEGRLILPQVQVLRDLLDHHAQVTVCQPEELPSVFNAFRCNPYLVITDSQAYDTVASMVPDEVYLTSFSVVLARAKGFFDYYVQGTPTLDHLQEGDHIAILESCTHSVTCEDIGRVKLPRLITRHVGVPLHFDVVSGLDALPRSITEYALVIQCGGCVVTPRQLASRLMPAIVAGVPVANYGLVLAYLNGIFERSMRVFRQANAGLSTNLL